MTGGPTDERPVLVIGGTGRQGGATARALIDRAVVDRAIPVRALVRDPDSAKAKELAQAGAVLVRGDLEDYDSLVAACDGVRAVFSVQSPSLSDPDFDAERNRGRNLVNAAAAAKVPQFVHTSVTGAGDWHRRVAGWADGTWHQPLFDGTQPLAGYWETKAAIDEYVRNAGFPYWTVLHPAGFMENFIRPSVYFENWTGDRIVSALAATTELALIAVDDIGNAAAAAIADPERFNKVDLELAGDRLTIPAIAAILSDVLGTPIPAPELSREEAISQGLLPQLAVSHEWNNIAGMPARPEDARTLGLSPVTFKTWAERSWH